MPTADEPQLDLFAIAGGTASAPEQPESDGAPAHEAAHDAELAAIAQHAVPPTPTAPATGELHERALSILRESLGPEAGFRDGQWEAIEALVARRAHLLVVQRTGWGKSSVYFVSTRLLREQGCGPTILVSPLLALMRDQIRAAERLGVRAASIDSTNTDQWDETTEAVLAGEIDLLLVSPERLASASFRLRVLEPLLPTIGMLVVDEAHCISDWGHDFRPDYRRIAGIVPRLPSTVAVLATTATANEAVTGDVIAQLGGKVELQRGPLARRSLRLQATHIAGESERMAWLATQLPEIPGSGIVYVLTKAHARRIAEFLRANGVDADHYTGGGAPGAREEVRKLELERRLLANEVKVVVATPALGMGFDKPDLAFVVHFQMPQSLIHYYQQVGRAGRAVDDSLGILLHGEGDKRITDWFIAQAFPPPDTFTAVLAAVRSSDRGLTVTELAKRSGVARGLTDKVLGQLAVEVNPPVEKVAGTWRATGASWQFDAAHMDDLTHRRHDEYARMCDYARGASCYMAYVARELDDPAAATCGHCAACVGHDLVPVTFDDELAQAAADFKVSSARTGRRPKKPAKDTTRVKRATRRKRSS